MASSYLCLLLGCDRFLMFRIMFRTWIRHGIWSLILQSGLRVNAFNPEFRLLPFFHKFPKSLPIML